MCSWQFDGQCSILSVHSNAESGRAPSWASVAWPENEISSPTAQVSELDGESMWATGGVEPAVIVWWTVSLWPSGSVTLTPTLIDPLAV